MDGQFSGSYEVELFEVFWGSVQCFTLISKEGSQSMPDISAQQQKKKNQYMTELCKAEEDASEIDK